MSSNVELTGVMITYLVAMDGEMLSRHVFELIMRYGGFDEYLDIWRVHGMLHVARSQVMRNLTFMFLYS